MTARASARLTWRGQTAVTAVQAGAVRGVLLAAEHVLGVSRQRVPLDEATLERSGQTSVDDADITAAVSYDTPYAVRQHEDMTYRHLPGRQAKYLETTVLESGPVVEQIIAAQVRRALR